MQFVGCHERETERERREYIITLYMSESSLQSWTERKIRIQFRDGVMCRGTCDVLARALTVFFMLLSSDI